MSDAGLTIGRLADYVGVTVRAIRHYHERGLLAEPDRDASGYRRYGAQAVLDLTRIKILADAGVPLARIEEVLDADPGRLPAFVAEIDAHLERRITELEERRRRIADLAAGDSMFLPPDLIAFLDELRAAGVGAQTVRTERDAWILLLARYPERGHEWLAIKRRDLADPDYRELYRRFDELAGLDPADARVAELADALVRYTERYARDATITWEELDDPTAVALLASHFDATASPALERLYELVDARLPGGLSRRSQPGGANVASMARTSPSSSARTRTST